MCVTVRSLILCLTLTCGAFQLGHAAANMPSLRLARDAFSRHEYASVHKRVLDALKEGRLSATDLTPYDLALWSVSIHRLHLNTRERAEHFVQRLRSNPEQESFLRFLLGHLRGDPEAYRFLQPQSLPPPRDLRACADVMRREKLRRELVVLTILSTGSDIEGKEVRVVLDRLRPGIPTLCELPATYARDLLRLLLRLYRNKRPEYIRLLLQQVYFAHQRTKLEKDRARVWDLTLMLADEGYQAFYRGDVIFWLDSEADLSPQVKLAHRYALKAPHAYESWSHINYLAMRRHTDLCALELASAVKYLSPVQVREYRLQAFFDFAAKRFTGDKPPDLRRVVHHHFLPRCKQDFDKSLTQGDFALCLGKCGEAERHYSQVYNSSAPADARITAWVGLLAVQSKEAKAGLPEWWASVPVKSQPWAIITAIQNVLNPACAWVNVRGLSLWPDLETRIEFSKPLAGQTEQYLTSNLEALTRVYCGRGTVREMISRFFVFAGMPDRAVQIGFIPTATKYEPDPTGWVYQMRHGAIYAGDQPLVRQEPTVQSVESWGMATGQILAMNDFELASEFLFELVSRRDAINPWGRFVGILLWSTGGIGSRIVGGADDMGYKTAKTCSDEEAKGRLEKALEAIVSLITRRINEETSKQNLLDLNESVARKGHKFEETGRAAEHLLGLSGMRLEQLR